MFRKIVHIALSFLLLVSTVGVSVSMHYCADEHVSTSIFKEAETCCGEPCCETTFEHFQVDDDFVNSNVQTLSPQIDLPLITDFIIQFVVISFDVNREDQDFYIDKSPPLPISTFLAILQRYMC